MRLGISSDCIHFKTPDGHIATANHILKRQIEALAEHFESVIICCPFIDFPNDLSHSIYDNEKIKFLSSPSVGGNRFTDKIKLLKTIPAWIKLFKQVDDNSDLVYQRFPNNLNIPGFFYFYFKRKKVFATFTGSWDKDPVSSFSTRFQRYFLKSFFKGPVWVYTNSNSEKKHIHKGFSPSYSFKEWQDEEAFIEKKIAFLKELNSLPLKMISVGTLCKRKNQSFILDTCVKLKQAGLPFELAIVGAGSRMEEYKNFINKNEICDSVKLKGSMHYSDLKKLYRQYDYVVQSPTSEPYGKVPVEGFFHGLIPIISSSHIMADYLTSNGSKGFIFDLKDKNSLFVMLKNIYNNLSVKDKVNIIYNRRLFVKDLTIENWAAIYLKEIEAFNYKQ